MYGYMLQDWITIKGSATTGVTVVQSEQDWAGFQPYQDIVAWLEVKSVTLSGLTSINLSYETAPAKDDSLFSPMLSTFPFAMSVTTTPKIDKVLLGQNPQVPLARWVRWKLTTTGTGNGSEYGACFRIFCSVNAVGTIG